MNKLLLMTCLLAASCYKAEIQLKGPDQAGMPSALVNNAYHWSLIGVFEVSDPVNIQAACNGDPASIHEEVSVPGGVINLLLNTFVPILGVFNPTVSC
jgi:hypothetical protein